MSKAMLMLGKPLESYGETEAKSLQTV